MQFVQDPQTGLYTNPAHPGELFRLEEGRGYVSVGRSEPQSAQPANCAPIEEPANAASETANTVLRSYMALPVGERQRFFVMLDEAEEDFSLESIKRLDLALNQAQVDPTDRAAFERFLHRYSFDKSPRAQGLGGYIRGGSGR